MDFDDISLEAHDPDNDECGCIECALAITIIKGTSVFESITTTKDKREWLIFDRIGQILGNFVGYVMLMIDEENPVIPPEMITAKEIAKLSMVILDECHHLTLTSEGANFRLPPSVATFNQDHLDFAWTLAINLSYELTDCE